MFAIDERYAAVALALLCSPTYADFLRSLAVGQYGHRRLSTSRMQRRGYPGAELERIGEGGHTST